MYISQQHGPHTPLRIVGFAQDGEGEIILVDHPGSLHRLAAQDPAPRENTIVVVSVPSTD